MSIPASAPASTSTSTSTSTGTPTGTASPDASETPGGFESQSAAVKRRMLIIVNPYASTVSDRLRHLVVYALQGRFEVDAVDTEARGHATELCREAAHEGYDVVVAFGGDGTVNEAANGLIGSPTPLTCLPGGSANVFGKMLGIPGELVDATEHLLALADDWRPRRVDLGMVRTTTGDVKPGDVKSGDIKPGDVESEEGWDGEQTVRAEDAEETVMTRGEAIETEIEIETTGNTRYFTFASGLGVDASVVERVDANPRRKARYGAYYFTWVALRTFTRRYLLSPPRMEVVTDGQTLHGVTTIVQNGSPFTYFQSHPIEIADGTTLDSGSLCGCVLHRATPLSMPSIAVRAFWRRARVSRHRQVTGLNDLHELIVRSADERPLPLQVDGDYLGEVREARYSIEPAALSVLA